MRRQFLSIVGEGLFEGQGNAALRGTVMQHRRGRGRALMSMVTTAGRHPAGIDTRDVLAPAMREVSAAKGTAIVIRWQRSLARGVLALALVVGLGGPALAKSGKPEKLDNLLKSRAGRNGWSRVIVTLKPGADPSGEVKRLGGKLGRRLGLINGLVIELPNGVIKTLADHPAVESLHYDRPTGGEMNRVAVTVGARAVQADYGYTGAGVGVAVIDSGTTNWHDDLTYQGSSSVVRVKNGQRVAAFVDFVNGRMAPYDDNGHGTHVAGIIAGNGLDSLGARAGIAPSAHLVSLKVLDDRGRGVISNVIAALEWVVANKASYNLRVINLSVGAAVTESYRTDPLAVAAKHAVDAGVVIVTAAGNLGKNSNDQIQYGGITAPGNAPWVLTVGAFSHEGTVVRTDDVMAGYSSRGPTAIDFAAKPDVVAPGTGIVSLSDPLSAMYVTKAAYLLAGSLLPGDRPYLSLTGTSMASPVVAGTVALMLQANPALTPNMVKAILQYTAQSSPQYNALTQGAGFLNSYGAVQLARFFRTAQPGSKLPMPRTWSKQIIWGNHRITGGVIRPNANAFELGTTWGAAVDRDGDNLVWGTLLKNDGENLVWGTADLLSADNLVWGTVLDPNGDNLVWGTARSGDNLVWGTLSGDDNIVWGTDCGGANCENLVWGTSISGDNLVWGTARSADNLVWGTAASGDNLVWGTSGDVDNLVWGTSSEDDNLVWGTSGEDAPMFDDPIAEPVNFDQSVFDSLFGEPLVTVPVAEQNLVTEPVTAITNAVGILGGL
jgi:serine protease AprX